MARITLPRRGLLTAATALAALALTAGCGGDDTGGMNHGGGTGAPTPAGAAFNDTDVTFAQNMIAHHQQAVQMADLAGTKASDPQVKQLAAQVKTAQEPEIATMTGWLTTWGRPSMPAGGHGNMAMPGMMSDAEMAQLHQASGVDFDRMFARMMIAHHNGAIQMAKEQQANGANPDAKSLAATVEKTQAAEVSQLEAILDRL